MLKAFVWILEQEGRQGLGGPEAGEGGIPAEPSSGCSVPLPSLSFPMRAKGEDADRQ